jgi:DNA-binding winged helix-turn-helix (wHTH) protein
MADRYRAEVLSIGGQEVDPVARVVRANGQERAIQEKPLRHLLYLVENAGRIVSRDEQMREVWPGVTVGQQALRFALHGARAALGDNGRSQTHIRTIQGGGISLIARVERGHPVQGTKGGTGSGGSPLLRFQRHWAWVEEGLARTRHGLGQALLIEGPSGVGKSALLGEARRFLYARGFAVLAGKAVRASGNERFAPWGQVFGSVTKPDSASSSSEALAAIPGILEGAIRATQVEKRASRASRSTALSEYRDQIVAAILRAASHDPVAILVDDIGFGAVESLDLFAHLAQSLADSAVLIVGA